jgi:minichromosome maintenance protein 10
MGREGQAKAKRKFGRDADRELKALLEKDKEGMRAVVRAREVAKMMDEKDGKRE